MPKILSDNDRKLKKEYIIEVALDMFDNLNYFEITMNKLAKNCSIAKGTLFNYFETKETLFTEILYKEYFKWGEYELQQLAQHKLFTKQKYKEFIINQTKDVLYNRLRLVRLVSLKRTILNNNVSPKLLVEEIAGLDRIIKQISNNTEEKIDFLKKDQIYKLYMTRHIIILGAYCLATSENNIKKIKKIVSDNFAAIEIEKTIINTTKEYLDLYCC